MGGDILRLISEDAINNFNPRLRMGGDICMCPGLVLDENISIHASVWEATYGYGKGEEIVGISIHASVWEATHLR